MSSLRRFQKDPRNVLNTALTMFRSKKIRTAVVEGQCDKRFLSQWIPSGTPIRFDGFDGKALVELAFTNSRLAPFSNYDFLFFFADVDFDVVAKRDIHDHPSFIYNVFCFDERRLHYNDLETFLLNTRAFEKVLVNLDIEAEQANGLRDRLERASRVSGSLQAADVLVRQRERLRSSVLNGFEIRGFFDAKEIAFDEPSLHKALPRWSNYPEYVDDLIQMAAKLDRESPSSWSLTRGHDLTEMLALYLEQRGHKGMTKERLELMLRLACEFDDFKRSPMGRRFAASGGTSYLCGNG